MEIRQTRVADSLRPIDSKVLLISTATGGSTTTVVDVNIKDKYEDDCFIDYYVVFLNGDNAGLCSRIIDYVKSTNTITFADTLTSVSAGDIYAVVSDLSKWQQDNIGDFLSKINQATLKDTLGMPDLSDATVYTGLAKDTVYFDADSGITGTDYPNGTPEYPVSDEQDTIDIASNRNINTIKLVGGTFTVPSAISNLEFEGTGDLNTISVNFNGKDIDNCIFRKVRVTGGLDNSVTVELDRCLIGDINSNTGYSMLKARNCYLREDTSLGADGLELKLFGVEVEDEDDAHPINTGGVDFLMTGAEGNFEIRGQDVANKTSRIHLNHGEIEIDSSCTEGDIYIYGEAEVTDNSGASCTVHDRTPFTRDRGLDNISKLHDAVYVDTGSVLSGTDYPLGTPEAPVDNIDDAITIKDDRGINNIIFKGTVTPTVDLDGVSMIGYSTEMSLIDLNDVEVKNGTKFYECTIFGDGDATGTDNVLIADKCYILQSLSNFKDVFINESMMYRDIDITSERLMLRNSTIMRGAGVISTYTVENSLQITNCIGNFKVVGLTAIQRHIIETYGEVELDATCDNGEMYVFGNVELTDNSSLAVYDRTPFTRDRGLDNISKLHDAVYVDTGSDISGTDYPNGTPEYPVSDIDDAIDIANARSLRNIFIINGTALTPTKDMDDLNFIGRSRRDCTITLDNGATEKGTVFKNLLMTGVAGTDMESGDTTTFIDCMVVDELRGFKNVVIENTDFYSSPTYVNRPTIQCDYIWGFGIKGEVNLKAEYGGKVHGNADIILQDLGDGEVCDIHLNSGKLEIDASCHNFSSVYVFGNAEVTQSAMNNFYDYTSQGREKGQDDIYNNIILREESDTATYGDAGGEQDIFEITPTEMQEVLTIMINLSDLTEDGEWKLYIDGEEVDSDTWTQGTDNEKQFFDISLALTETFKMTWEEDADEGADRDIPYSVRYRGD